MSDKKLTNRKLVAGKFAEMICKHHSLDLDPKSAAIVKRDPVECMGMTLDLEMLEFTFEDKSFPFPSRLVDDLPEFILEDRMSDHIRLKDLKELKAIIDAFKPE